MGQKQKKDKTEIVTGLGRRTRGGIKLAALRFQTWGGDIRNSPASLRGFGKGNSHKTSIHQEEM